MQPTVSVLIPIHNAANTLKTSLDSVKRQTLQEIEIICINDGSTDRSAEILESYAQDPRFKIISLPENQGTFLARKQGLKAASGKYIMFLDADDWFEPDACETAAREIQRHNVQIYHFGTRVESPTLSWRERREIEQSLIFHPGYLKGDDTFILTESGENKYDHLLCDKIFSSDLCKKVYQSMPDAHIICMEDFFTFVLLSLEADSYYGSKRHHLLHYYFATGIWSGTQKKISPKQFAVYCQALTYFPVVLNLLRQKGVEEKYIQRFQLSKGALLTCCFQKFYLLENSDDGLDCFLKCCFDNNKESFYTANALYSRLALYETYLRDYHMSYSVRLGLFLTWLPRKLLSLLTGRRY